MVMDGQEVNEGEDERGEGLLTSSLVFRCINFTSEHPQMISDLCLNLSWHPLLCGSDLESDSSPVETGRATLTPALAALLRQKELSRRHLTELTSLIITHISVVEIDAPVASSSGGDEAVS